MPKTICIVDDDKNVLAALTVFLQAHGYETATFSSGNQFLSQVESLAPSCLIMDVKMPVIDGMTVLRHLDERDIHLPTIMMTGFGDVRMAVDAMKLGAVDFLEKPFDDVDILEKVEYALTKGFESPHRPEDTEAGAVDLSFLTPRERNVLDHLLLGESNKVIAFELGISARTVEIHRANIMRKTGARNVADLVRRVLAPGSELSAK